MSQIYLFLKNFKGAGSSLEIYMTHKINFNSLLIISANLELHLDVHVSQFANPINYFNSYTFVLVNFNAIDLLQIVNTLFRCHFHLYSINIL